MSSDVRAVARRQRHRGFRRGSRHGLVMLVVVVAVFAAWGGPPAPDPDAGVRVVEQFPVAPQERLDSLVSDEDPPNVVFVLTDDQNPDELALMSRTQRLLVERGVSFDANISPHPLCCPARAELLTGQYAQNNQVLHNGGPHGGHQALDTSYPTIPERFADAGYRTGLVGKYLNGYEKGEQLPEPGWERFDPLTRGIYSYDRYSFRGEQGEDATWRQDETPYVTNSIARRSNDAVRDLAGDDPFLLFSWHVAPHYKPTGKVHAPPPAAPGDRGKYRDLRVPSLRKPNYNQTDVTGQPRPIRKRPVMNDKKNERMYRGRVRSLQAVDRAVASLVRTLRQTGELSSTYIVFASDNGYAMGEHRLFGKNVLTREIMEVPLVVRGPGITPDTTASAPSTLVDVPATLLDLAGIEDRDGLDGVSLLGPLLGENVAGRDTTLVQTGGRQGDGWQYRGVETSRYLYAVDDDTGDGMLYDHDRDFWQLDNRITDPDYADVVTELEARAARLRACAGPGCNLQFGPDPSPRDTP